MIPAEQLDWRVCVDCEARRPPSEFYRLAISPDGFNPKCRECVKDTRAAKSRRKIKRDAARAAYPGLSIRVALGRLRRKRYEAKHPERALQQRLRSRGISIEDFIPTNARQAGACAVCSAVGPLVIDHDHTTGAFRGLVCYRCNTALGFFEGHGVAGVRRMVEYILNPPAQNIKPPEGKRSLPL